MEKYAALPSQLSSLADGLAGSHTPRYVAHDLDPALNSLQHDNFNTSQFAPMPRLAESDQECESSRPDHEIEFRQQQVYDSENLYDTSHGGRGHRFPCPSSYPDDLQLSSGSDVPQPWLQDFTLPRWRNNFPYLISPGNLTQVDAQFQNVQREFPGTLVPSLLPTDFNLDVVVPEITCDENDSPSSLHTESSTTLSADTLRFNTIGSNSPDNPTGYEHVPESNLSGSVNFLNTTSNYGSEFWSSNRMSFGIQDSTANLDQLHDFSMGQISMNAQSSHISTDSTTASMMSAENHLRAPQYSRLTMNSSADIITRIPTLEEVTLSRVERLFGADNAAEQVMGDLAGPSDIWSLDGSNDYGQQQITLGIPRTNRQNTSMAPRAKQSQGLKKTKQNNRSLSMRHTHQRLQNSAGQLQGSIITFRTKDPGRGKLDAHSRAAIARTRQLKACTRCRSLKKQCHWPDLPYLPCETCQKQNAQIFKMPCSLRTKIIDVVLVRLPREIVSDVEENPLNFIHREMNWLASADDHSHGLGSRRIQITQDVGAFMTVEVVPFIPADQDPTAYEWKDAMGNHRMDMPLYCIANWEDLCLNIKEYVQHSTFLYLKNLLDSSNPIIWETFNSALASEDPLVHEALKFWSACRVIERTWQITGNDTLGMDPVWDPNPWNGIVPITPIMDNQLDDVAISEVLDPLEKSIRGSLAKRLSERLPAKKDWFNLYLTVFILLHNIEAQIAHDRDFCDRYGLPGRFGGAYKRYTECENRMHVAKTMLAHFHYICRGWFPISLTIDQLELLREFTPDDSHRNYLYRLQKNIQARKENMLELRTKHRYETDLYWCHQMFFEDWEPGSGYILELHECP